MRLSEVAQFDWRSAFKAKDGLPEADSRALDEYFSQFAAIPEGKDCPCIKCGEPLGGFFGTFRWALTHGECFCGKCKYPGRALHYDAGPIKRLELILQYHPSLVTEPEERETGQERWRRLSAI